MQHNNFVKRNQVFEIFFDSSGLEQEKKEKKRNLFYSSKMLEFVNNRFRIFQKNDFAVLVSRMRLE
jgi:hypothetical protein